MTNHRDSISIGHTCRCLYLKIFVKVGQIASVNTANTNIRVTVTVFGPLASKSSKSTVHCGSLSMSDFAETLRVDHKTKKKKIKFRFKFRVALKANCTQRRQEVSHNSLGTSYCQIPAKRTGALIEGRNRADREVPACVARGGMWL